MQIWTEHPARTDVDAVVRRYFDLLRAGEVAEAEQLVVGSSSRHVLKALWKGSVGRSAGADDTPPSFAAEDEQDLSWLRELDLGDFTGDHAGDRVHVEITYRAEVIEVALSFWVKPTDAGWVVAGPATLW
ncbi:hypothetical protein [Saccharothrix xinjiangensis]|uniref:Lumazine-binding protein n=1 Tax=Saccharothrix xinjiangensis TaxID=204798 RepID=A0ABV9XWR2_9PSEU